MKSGDAVVLRSARQPAHTAVHAASLSLRGSRCSTWSVSSGTHVVDNVASTGTLCGG